ncbi:MAG TPA: hypothetical protein QF572_19725 [Vicinamibacterales bacterium]|jgi:hypothetical protein|nr:hypothetical protein [Vicinamibacterales bacterium]|tara:strand:+ start:458 stop:673 length:216 start_codon:yes stop_codon:yes gene_type:complete
MTSTEYRRLRRLLQRERQKGVLAVDQLIDLAGRAAEQEVSDLRPEPEDRGRSVATRGAGEWGSRPPGGAVR